MIDLDEPCFTIAQVAGAAGVPANTLRSWFQRGHFSLGEHDKRASFGDAHLLSLRTALMVGTAVELYRFDVHPARGAKIVSAFTVLGEIDRKTGEMLRNPGELFPGDGIFTALVAYPDKDDGVVVRFDNKSASIRTLFESYLGRETSALVVWLNWIDRRVRVALQETIDRKVRRVATVEVD